MKTNGFLIAGGEKIVPLAITVSIICLFICDTLGVLAALFTLFLVFVFRNDSRYIFANSSNILSPVDGKVLAVDNDGGKYKIYCKVRPCDSNKVLSPIAGKIMACDHQKGLNLDPNSFKASLLNEQVVFDISNEDSSKNISLKLVSGRCSTALEITDKEDIEQGEAIAVMLEGIAVISLDNSSELNVKFGDTLKSGQTNLIRG